MASYHISLVNLNFILHDYSLALKSLNHCLNDTALKHYKTEYLYLRTLEPIIHIQQENINLFFYQIQSLKRIYPSYYDDYPELTDFIHFFTDIEKGNVKINKLNELIETLATKFPLSKIMQLFKMISIGQIKAN